MNFRKIFICAGIALSIAGCKKDMPGSNMHPGGSDTTVIKTPTPYAITETFESGSKKSYAAANVTLSTGIWNLNDALIGNLAGDVKDGDWAVRLRTGDIAMNFDINGVTQVYIKHAKYGSDASSVWQLKMSTDGGTTYTQLGPDISETNTTLVIDSFKVTATSKVRFEIVKTGTTRINIDDITFKGTGDPGITVGQPDTTGTGADTTGTGSSSADRGVVVGPDAPPVSGDNSDLLFGNPSGATPNMVMMDNYLIDQGYYVESYNATKAEPNWVSWHLDASNTTNVSSRLNNFAGFNGLPSDWFRVESNSYNYNTYGFDRGHNCPSADRTSSINANSSTFLMTNMIPQAPQNNQQTWANLENYLREQVLAGYEVYIIMGSYGTGGTGVHGAFNTITTTGNGHINVPANIWKVAVIVPVGNDDISRVTNTTRVIAVSTPNINTIDQDWKQYIVTVRDIEHATGYNLLSALPQSVQDAIETKKDGGI